jgi:secondary thiamine-phosphate synthase enzyme
MQRFTLEVATDGDTDIIDLTPLVAAKIRDVRGDGLVHLFVIGSTAALTTIEHEPGLIKHDLPAALQRWAPDDARYEHEATWHDDNGHSHIRAALIGPGVTVPFTNGRLLTGEWQQVILIDFDTRPRRRTVVGSVMT